MRSNHVEATASATSGEARNLVSFTDMICWMLV
jgi:hypothetical protein